MSLYQYVNDCPLKGNDPFGLWTKKHPDPWKSPEDILCGRYSGIARKACGLFYNCLISTKRGKQYACNFAKSKCYAECFHYYDEIFCIY